MIYVDGHMMASWSRLPMHKGKSTMLGRIMAGSHAVIAHDDTGRAVFVAYYTYCISRRNFFGCKQLWVL
jgi:hypothetical protein